MKTEATNQNKQQPRPTISNTLHSIASGFGDIREQHGTRNTNNFTTLQPAPSEKLEPTIIVADDKDMRVKQLEFKKEKFGELNQPPKSFLISN